MATNKKENKKTTQSAAPAIQRPSRSSRPVSSVVSEEFCFSLSSHLADFPLIEAAQQENRPPPVTSPSCAVLFPWLCDLLSLVGTCFPSLSPSLSSISSRLSQFSHSCLSSEDFLGNSNKNENSSNEQIELFARAWKRSEQENAILQAEIRCFTRLWTEEAVLRNFSSQQGKSRKKEEEISHLIKKIHQPSPLLKQCLDYHSKPSLLSISSLSLLFSRLFSHCHLIEGEKRAIEIENHFLWNIIDHMRQYKPEYDYSYDQHLQGQEKEKKSSMLAVSVPPPSAVALRLTSLLKRRKKNAAKIARRLAKQTEDQPMFNYNSDTESDSDSGSIESLRVPVARPATIPLKNPGPPKSKRGKNPSPVLEEEQENSLKSSESSSFSRPPALNIHDLDDVSSPGPLTLTGENSSSLSLFSVHREESNAPQIALSAKLIKDSSEALFSVPPEVFPNSPPLRFSRNLFNPSIENSTVLQHSNARKRP